MTGLILSTLLARAQAPPGWQVEPYVQPRIGGFVATSGGRTHSGASLGAEAGLRYLAPSRRPPVWQGRARLQGDAVLGSDELSGLELRLGNLAGPAWRHLALRTGPDLFWNQYRVGAARLEPSPGLAWPLIGATGIPGVDLWAGVEPAWLLAPERRVDWSEAPAPGLGHEFTWMGGIGFQSGGRAVSLGWRYRITALGGQHGVSLGLRL